MNLPWLTESVSILNTIRSKSNKISTKQKIVSNNKSFKSKRIQSKAGLNKLKRSLLHFTKQQTLDFVILVMCNPVTNIYIEEVPPIRKRRKYKTNDEIESMLALITKLSNDINTFNTDDRDKLQTIYRNLTLHQPICDKKRKL